MNGASSRTRLQRKQLLLEFIRLNATAESVNLIYKTADILEASVHGSVAKVRDLIDFSQLLQDLGADIDRGDFTFTGFQVMHDFIHRYFQPDQSDRALLTGFGQAVH